MNTRNLNHLVTSGPRGTFASRPGRHRGQAHRRPNLFLENIQRNPFPFLLEIELLVEKPLIQNEGQFEPCLDLQESDQAFHLTVEMAGVSRDDLSVEIKGNALFLRGKKIFNSFTNDASQDPKCHAQECSYGEFERQIELPGEVEAEQAKATFRDGILTVRLPKTEPGQSVRLLVGS
jgi:HSP20 family molecular chaperone IbpA